MTSDQQKISALENESDASSDEEYEGVPLSEVINPVLGKTPKRKNDNFWGGDIKWASAKDISQNGTRKIYDTSEYMTAEGKEVSNAKTMPKGTLVVIARGSMGLSAQLGEPMAFNQSCYGLEADNSRLLDDFLYYAWNYRFNQIQSVSHGTIFDTITMDSFKDIDIPLPPLETQKKICNVLTSIDDKIEVNNRINANLEEMAQSIFKSWFVDLEPYEEFKDSELGEIPKQFEVAEVQDICSEIRNGGTPKRSNDDYWGGDNPWIKTGELSGGVITDTEEKVTQQGLENNNCTLVDENTVLVALYGASVGNVGLTKIPATFNQACCSLSAKKEVGYGFVFQLLKYLKPRLKNLSRGSAQQNISQGIIKEQKLALPPNDDLQRFKELVHPLYDKMNYNSIQSRRLSELRNTLLPELMSGEVRVDDIKLDSLKIDTEV